jgi:hypothetical protein
MSRRKKRMYSPAPMRMRRMATRMGEERFFLVGRMYMRNSGCGDYSMPKAGWQLVPNRFEEARRTFDRDQGWKRRVRDLWDGARGTQEQRDRWQTMCFRLVEETDRAR